MPVDAFETPRVKSRILGTPELARKLTDRAAPGAHRFVTGRSVLLRPSSVRHLIALRPASAALGTS
jgi:hypothetical protein